MRSAALTSLLFAFVPLTANAVDFVCPERISTTQKLVGVQKGWVGFSESEPGHAYVSGVSVYYGHPREQGMLKPYNEMAKEQYWSFGRPPADAQALYMACNYHSTSVQLIQALPSNTKKCTNKRLGMLRCEVFER
jgi:hypothetical protein